MVVVETLGLDALVIFANFFLRRVAVGVGRARDPSALVILAAALAPTAHFREIFLSTEGVTSAFDGFAPENNRFKHFKLLPFLTQSVNKATDTRVFHLS